MLFPHTSALRHRHACESAPILAPTPSSAELNAPLWRQTTSTGANLFNAGCHSANLNSPTIRKLVHCLLAHVEAGRRCIHSKDVDSDALVRDSVALSTCLCVPTGDLA